MSTLATGREPPAAAATRQLFETHRRRIFGFCLSQLGNHHDAEDAAQTTFLYAFGCLERGIVPDAELAWLFRIAHNECRTRRRSLGRRRRIEAPTDFEACEYALAGPERGDDELLGLAGALAAMPANQRSALLLREWQGLSYAEIAAKLTISQSAVETLLFRARRTLASKLSRIPRQAAVIANLPVLLRLLRRTVPTAGTAKTATALIAIGAVSIVGGRELEPSLAKRAPSNPHASQPLQTSAPPRPIYHPHASTAPAPQRRPPQPHQTEATPTADAATPRRTEPRTAPPAAAAPNPTPTAPLDAPPLAQVSLTTPPRPVAPLATTADELTGSTLTTATTLATTVALPVPPVSVPEPGQLLPLP